MEKSPVMKMNPKSTLSLLLPKGVVGKDCDISNRLSHDALLFQLFFKGGYTLRQFGTKLFKCIQSGIVFTVLFRLAVQF